MLDTCALYTFLNYISLFISLLNLYPDSELITINTVNKNPARDEIPEWDGQASTVDRFEEDVLILIFIHAVPKERKVTIGPRLLQQFPKGSPQREIGLELLKSGVL